MLSGITEFQFFPAEQSGGAEVLKAICEPFHHLGIEFFAKGGITLENMKSYLVRKEVVAVSAPDRVSGAGCRKGLGTDHEECGGSGGSCPGDPPGIAGRRTVTPPNAVRKDFSCYGNCFLHC